MTETGTDIAHAAASLAAGKLVAIPTETVYGLAANALNPQAVASIFEAKKRPFFDPLIVHIADISEVEKCAAYFPPLARKLAAAFWPGPLTLILTKTEIVPDLVTAGQPTVGLRVPNHPLTLALLKQVDFPLAAPSANPFGYVSPTRASHVASHLGNEVDYILDGGDCEVGLESTIIGFDTHDQPVILRLGGLEISRIEEITGELGENLHQNSNPAAPGQLDMHYAPRCLLVKQDDIALQLQEAENFKTALIRFTRPIDGYDPEKQFILAPDGSLKTAASRLFGILRQLDNEGYNLAIVENVPDEGLGRAINDRLKRAMVR